MLFCCLHVGSWPYSFGGRLACSPPTKSNRVQFLAGSPSDVRMWASCRKKPLIGGFSRGSPVCTTLSFRRSSILASITLIGSEYLAVMCRHTLCTHSAGNYLLNSFWCDKGCLLTRPCYCYLYTLRLRFNQGRGFQKTGLWLANSYTSRATCLRQLKRKTPRSHQKMDRRTRFVTPVYNQDQARGSGLSVSPIHKQNSASLDRIMQTSADDYDIQDEDGHAIGKWSQVSPSNLEHEARINNDSWPNPPEHVFVDSNFPLPHEIISGQKRKHQKKTGAAVVEHPRSGNSRISASGNRAGRCRWSAGFLWDLMFPPFLHSVRCSILISFCLHRFSRPLLTTSPYQQELKRKETGKNVKEQLKSARKRRKQLTMDMETRYEEELFGYEVDDDCHCLYHNELSSQSRPKETRLQCAPAVCFCFHMFTCENQDTKAQKCNKKQQWQEHMLKSDDLGFWTHGRYEP
ncbi:hypothetical protein PR048_029100 [Dryococelus australis]|uniref:Uncharacterized protein n=1 Tax=Dryococelus australis TaxID=614101 RepID=A0ABQ9GFU2_9NEOP|nr:hypothetical protein PR048_029100 [Dryococelus australis]